MSDAVKGLFIGMFLGIGGGLGASIWFIDDTYFLHALLIGGVLGAVAGMIWGDDFFDFVKDWWGRL